MINYPALKAELVNDPIQYGYATSYSNGADQALADMLNLTRDGSNGGAAIPVRRADITAEDVYAAVDVSDYTALPANPNATSLSTERRFLAWFTGLTALERIRLLNDDGSDTPVVKNFKAMFAGGTGTLTRLNALANRNGSRAEQLFGTGTFITATDIVKARQS